ncbi:site-2 protease family protein [Haloarcula marismortui]|uniref:Zinc metalloprotease n=2 Tax=Haloarcula marismortui (strain ATCC 43049 / DSM 3752 / JCM 8966 / VKM B-1809) TaxID=272569 RepID=A0A4P8K006_HALMA|nr:site-2 protease family protein [Haloarcula marismortui]QCP91776.1 peptidase M50 [Haloarcula marismortui ATCC 43049]
MRNFHITTIWGIPIRVNVSLLIFLPVLAWIIGSGAQISVYAGIVSVLSGVTLDLTVLTAGQTPWLIGTAAAVGLFASVALHELGHAWAAMRYGLRVEAITLWILGGLASLEAIPKEWNRELVIALAGPAVSILTGLACYAALFALPASAQVTLFVIGWLAVTNIFLAVFNMLPAFPMDGGRVLRALLARTRPYATATRIAARIGTGFAVLFAVVGVLSFSPLLLLLALFVYGAASSESRTVALAALLDGLSVDDVASPLDATIEANASVEDLVDRMFADRRTEFAVTRGGDVVGVVTVDDFRELSKAEREADTVADLMEADLPRFPAAMAAFDALVELDTARASAAFVDGPEGTRVVSRDDFSSAMEMRRLVDSPEPF